MFALLLCVPLLALQGGGPELPEGLQANPAVTEAWSSLQNPAIEIAARNEASALVLQNLLVLPAAEQWAFLLAADGQGVFSADLRSHYRHIAKDWPAFEARVLETLALANGQDDALLLGAIHAAGSLATSSALLIEQLATMLDNQSRSSDARLALENLTGREFGTHLEFLEWWATSKDLGREIWLERAHEIEKERELADWRRRLQGAAVIGEVLNGVRHPRQPIRVMAYEALRRLDFQSLNADTNKQVADALWSALEEESDASLRTALLALVPQVLEGREAVNVLLRALQFGVAEERLAAARYLQLVEPMDMAWDGLLRGLEGAYPTTQEGPAGQVAVRQALWSGLGSLAERVSSTDSGRLDSQIQIALEVDNDRPVRASILSAIRRLGGPIYLEVLHPLAIDAETSEVERSEVLIAMTGVAERHPELTTLQEILPSLLADKQPQVRRQAIASMRKLKLANAQLLMVQRLEAETEVVLQKDMLTVLGESKLEGVLEPLLDFVPSATLREAYGKALVMQIGSGFMQLEQVRARLVKRRDLEFAFLVVRTFPLDNLNPEQRLELDRKHATAVCEFLMLNDTDKGNESYAADAVTRLRDLMAVEPESVDWPVYLIEMELKRGEVVSILPVLLELLPNPKVDEKRKWEIACAALIAIDLEAAPELNVNGRAVVDALMGLGEPEAKYESLFEEIQVKFPSPVADEPLPTPDPAEETPKPEQATGGEEPSTAGEQPAETPASDNPDGSTDPVSEPTQDEPGSPSLEKPT